MQYFILGFLSCVALWAIFILPYQKTVIFYEDEEMERDLEMQHEADQEEEQKNANLNYIQEQLKIKK